VKRVHFIGICGTAMATLAVMLKERGIDVRGSDDHAYPPMSELLEQHGIKPFDGYKAEHVSTETDTVVIGNAVSRGNPEVEVVLSQRMNYVSLPELVRDEFLRSSLSIVISGTHGKTTTSFMTAWLLAEFGLDPGFFIGGVSKNFATSGRVGRGQTFVIEGDEYDSAFFDKTAKFFKYLPKIVVVGGVEFDHADIYRDLDELRVAFRSLIQLLPREGRAILCSDDREALALREEAACTVETFGVSDDADWRAIDIRQETERTIFDVLYRGKKAARISLPLLGVFNVRNALAAIAVASAVGVPPEETENSFKSFKGVKRRLEVSGIVKDITVYDDFAHHPTAVKETLIALRSVPEGGRIFVIFEPRSATACRRVFQREFSEALSFADKVVVAPVYRSTLPVEERLSEARLVADLSARGVDACHVPIVEEIVEMIAREARSGDRIIVMSNGDFGGIHHRLLKQLNKSGVNSSR
jgi:UDP-N-acetylmuramate: L-alanyl-gamma-D-glutamyl-meso-diaminopimelate ligase